MNLIILFKQFCAFKSKTVTDTYIVFILIVKGPVTDKGLKREHVGFYRTFFKFYCYEQVNS